MNILIWKATLTMIGYNYTVLLLRTRFDMSVMNSQATVTILIWKPMLAMIGYVLPFIDKWRDV